MIDISLLTFNCTACHGREGMGGVAANRNDFFQTTNLNLGDQGRIPPTLSGVGAKLNEKWMRDVLVNGRSVRPYMNTRMPQFGEENIGHLTSLFQENDHLAVVEYPAFEDQEAMRKHGLEIVGNQGLNCVACHTYQYKLSDTMPAVDLTEMAERLKKDWFHQYMLAPQSFSPNTVMPSFWPQGKAIRKDIAGSPAEQVEAIWQYLLDGRQANAPRGVIREPLEIVVDDEARMLRRSYGGIGKRGIGVGYPGGVNLAFDAEQMRLAMIWRGKFVDPAGVWYGQGHGNVRPMGPTINFPSGPEFDFVDSPWVVDEGRPPNHQFLGYELDSQRRPTFLYRFNGVNVEDYFSEFLDPDTNRPQLRRSITFTAELPLEGLQFRLASGKLESLESGQFHYEVEGRAVTIRIASEQTATIRSVDDQGSLVVALTLNPGENCELVIEYIWE
ncbi:MAG: hypothetical protein R3C03_09685 [Pirellulaceae bacterium]